MASNMSDTVDRRSVRYTRNGKLGNMEAYDLLPKALRKALQESVHNWSAAQCYDALRRKNPATGKRFTTAGLVLAIVKNDATQSVELAKAMGWEPATLLGE
jgi:hypothetical protein